MKNFLGLLLGILLVGMLGVASATPINFTPGSTGSNGNGGGTHNFSFDLGSFSDLDSVQILIDMWTYDQNFIVDVNGSNVVPLDANNPAIFAPAVSLPWTANSQGLPRLSIGLSQAEVAFEGTISSNSTGLTSLTYNQTSVPPIFQTGWNTLTIVNPDADGPDGINFSLRGSYAPVPEPATMVLFGIGLLGLTGVNQRKK